MQLTKIGFQGIQPGIPDFPVLFNPIRNLAELIEGSLAKPLPPLLANVNQPAFIQNFDMLIYRGPAYVELISHGMNVKRLPGDQLNNFPTGRIGNGLEYISSHNSIGNPLVAKL